MNVPPPRPQTAAANDARRRRTEDKLHQLARALDRMRKDKMPVTYPAAAARAGVSRTFLYDNPDARKLVTAAIAQTDQNRRQRQTALDDQAEACWRERALNAEQALKDAHTEIRSQRGRIGQLLGQLRDTERELTEDTVQRITAENITLKQRLRELTATNRAAEERLQAARSNNRFLDKRIADLEMQLEPPISP